MRATSLGAPIYVDFDETLIHAETDLQGRVGRIHPRPRAGKFLERLNRYASVYILSYAELGHVQQGLPSLGSRAQQAVSGILSREDLKPIIDQLKDIAKSKASPSQKTRVKREIIPIAPPGVMFDDQPVGSYLYDIKSAALGIGPELWIQVQPYNPWVDDGDALERAYRQFKRAFVGTTPTPV